jgi:hypothetical protein
MAWRTLQCRRGNRTGGRLFLITGLIKIMLPQKKEIAKLFIFTLTFPREIKYDCGAPATARHGTPYPSHETGFYLCARRMADNGVLPYRR